MSNMNNKDGNKDQDNVKMETTSGNEEKSANAKSAHNKNQEKKKTNKGCWMIAGIGCGLGVLVIGVIVALFVLLASVGSGMGDSSFENVVREGSGGKIAVIEVDGIIAHGDSQDVFAVAGASPTSIGDKLDKALADENVKGIILKINSPGGEVVASDLIYRKVKEASSEKPVVAWMSSLGASGGYLVAVGADKIVAHPNCITGSIGTILEVSNMDELYDKLGIETRTFKSGKYKDDEGIFDNDPDGEADEIYQGLVDQSYDDFVEAVAQGRDMDKGEVKNLADGRIYSGYQAKDNGLVDEVGDMDKAVSVMEELVGEEDMQIIEYETPQSFFSGFSGYESRFMEQLGLTKERRYSVGLYYLLEV
jgi:protease-4